MPINFVGNRTLHNKQSWLRKNYQKLCVFTLVKYQIFHQKILFSFCHTRKFSNQNLFEFQSARITFTEARQSYLLIRRTSMKEKLQPAVIWITGLSASGKTTIALSLVDEFKKQNIKVELLDGDEIRKKLQLHAFDEESRKKYNLAVGRMAAELEKKRKVVIASLISPYNDVRNAIRNTCLNFIEVYLSTNIATCMERDPKGLYRKALNGEIKDFTGISAPYEIPQYPELTLDTSCTSVEECRNSIMKFYWNEAQIKNLRSKMTITE